MTEEEVLELAAQKLPDAEIYENDFIKIPISKDLPFKIHNSVFPPKESNMYVITFRKITNRLNKTVWEFVSLDEE